MKLDRFSIGPDRNEPRVQVMLPDPNGQYVRYADVQALVLDAAMKNAGAFNDAGRSNLCDTSQLRGMVDDGSQAPDSTYYDNQAQEMNCAHEWNQTAGEADESGTRIYCLKCGQDGDA